jgi:hypothetical protein
METASQPTLEDASGSFHFVRRMRKRNCAISRICANLLRNLGHKGACFLRIPVGRIVLALLRRLRMKSIRESGL